MAYGYEAQIVRELAKFAARGALYRRKKPVHWCPKDATALAEAEVEYAEHTSPSIYVKLDLTEPLKLATGKPAALVIWTTTPWTLPANLAVAVHPDYTYALYDLRGTVVVVAKELLAAFLAECAPDELAVKDVQALGVEGAASLKNPERVLGFASGKELEGLRYRHPLYDRTSPVILGPHVTLEAGTGLVHTAPGHGHEDYEVGLKYGLDIYAPVDNRGHFTGDAGEFAGKLVFDANPDIVKRLVEKGALLSDPAATVTHSYPHCWRCKKPVIFRATDQWFISLETGDLRRKALEEIDRVQWIPKWGRERIVAMMQTRPDWCISRQRQWGVPIAIFYCESCHEPLVDAAVMERVAQLFEAEGADAWYEKTPAQLIPEGTRCACGGAEFRKESDILDVWFDSGVSFAAVCERRRNLSVPVDLYLEGSDQHRGWFNSALIAGVGTRDRAPFKAVLTHGFVVDGEGKKYSKSSGNYVPLPELLKKLGADVLRLWVAAEDYRDDVTVSPQVLDRLGDSYRKIRNTIRYCLSNLFDFDPAKDTAPDGAMTPLDRWALARLSAYTGRVRKAYDAYEFHLVYHETVQLCAVDLSAFYFDVLKDRLYCGQSKERRAAQTVLYRACRDLLRLLAPVLSFTCEEAWAHLPGEKTSTVFVAGLPEAGAATADAAALQARYEKLLAVRAAVAKAMEETRNAQAEAKKRGEKVIGNSLDARVVVSREGEEHAFLKTFAESELAELFLVSQVELRNGPAAVAVDFARGEKCVRCWRVVEDRGADARHPELCRRCAEAVEERA
jgi:isoleucyl-tRNA synthetase